MHGVRGGQRCRVKGGAGARPRKSAHPHEPCVRGMPATVRRRREWVDWLLGRSWFVALPVRAGFPVFAAWTAAFRPSHFRRLSELEFFIARQFVRRPPARLL